MNLKQRELIVFCALLFITMISKQTVLDHVFGMHLSEEKAGYISVLRASLNIGIGFIGLMKHEVWWIKQAWCLFYLIMLLIVVINILASHFMGRNVLKINFDILASPFFYLLACLLPRIMRKYV